MFEKSNYELLFGNCVDTLHKLPEKTFQCVVTSPPYYSLRNYGTEPQIWGGFMFCKHNWIKQEPRRSRSSDDKRSETGIQNESSFCDLVETELCSVCDAWRGELGLEPAPERFIQDIMEVFKEVYRVLRDDGILFVNIGDTYWNNAKNKHKFLQEKSACLIPQRFAIAMQEAGWIVRNEIIWEKNGLPESVLDRFTRNHEQVWMFTKKTDYFFDQDAVRTPHKNNDESQHPMGANRRTVWKMGTNSDKTGHVAPFCRELPEVAIKCATSQFGACAECNKSYIRDIERENKVYTDKGWKKNCTCTTDKVVPCVVLDPFSGSGSTGEVAMQLGRRFVGCELSEVYFADSNKRFQGDGSLF